MNKEPIILSIESSGNLCGVCLSEGPKIIADYSEFEKNTHDRLLSELIRRILEDNELSIKDIDAVAVSSGPGSFTGLRIGASIAKGLCFDNNPKLIAVPTLFAIAYSAKDLCKVLKLDGIIVAISSHKDMLYFQKFDINAKPVNEIEFIDLGMFKKLDLKNKLISGMNIDIINTFSIEYFNNLSAKFIANAALKLYNEQNFVIAEDFIPNYIMDFQPKIIK